MYTKHDTKMPEHDMVLNKNLKILTIIHAISFEIEFWGVSTTQRFKFI